MIHRARQRQTDRWAKQRLLAAEFLKAIGQAQPVGSFIERGPNWNAYLWPMLLADGKRHDSALAHFRSHGVDTFTLWGQCIELAKQYGYRPGSCPIAEQAVQRLLLLPCYAELSAGQRARILRAIERWPDRETALWRP